MVWERISASSDATAGPFLAFLPGRIMVVIFYHLQSPAMKR